MDVLQNALIKKSLPLSERVVEAFYAAPRHLFIPEYSLEKAYQDQALTIYKKPPFVSTISQPSFVLRILDLLELSEGQKVFELGTGSGWNTALLAFLVAPRGFIITTEIVPELAERAQKILEERHIENVKILNTDGFDGVSDEGFFDRIIFTAGSEEFPEKLFKMLKPDGLMVFVRQRPGDGEFLELIRKKDERADVKISIPCSFVSVVREKEIRDKESRHQDGTL